MGFSKVTSNTTINAKLTPFGRQELLKRGSSIITHFSIGDSDSYYEVKDMLKSGEIPDISGDLGTNGKSSNTSDNYRPKSLVYRNGVGNRKKHVEIGSNMIINDKKKIGYKTLSGVDLSYNSVNLNDYNSDSKVNWFYSFNLPITDADKTLFTSTTTDNGGYSDTAYSAIPTEEIFVISIPSDEYGEMIDGKSVKINLNGQSNNYEIYSTYENTLTKNQTLCASHRELSKNSKVFGNNIVFLFCDDIKPPNGDPNKSWSEKYGTTKPFNNGKPKFNYKDNNNAQKVADEPVGIMYLDKGIIVITHDTILSDYIGTSDNVNIEFNSITTEVTQEITCIIDRGEFTSTSNKTFSKGDNIRFSEIFLLDELGKIIAVGKSDRHIEKTPQEFMALGVKITV